jgi:regulator of replication initiation timing
MFIQDLCATWEEAYEKVLEENKRLKTENEELRKLIPSEIDKLEDIKSYVKEVNRGRRNSNPPLK